MIVRLLLAILFAVLAYWLCIQFLPHLISFIIAVIVGILLIKYDGV